MKKIWCFTEAQLKEKKSETYWEIARWNCVSEDDELFELKMDEDGTYWEIARWNCVSEDDELFEFKMDEDGTYWEIARWNCVSEDDELFEFKMDEEMRGQYFNQILTVVLELLDDPDSSIRELALSLLVEMLNNQKDSMDDSVEVSNEAERCLTVVLCQYDPFRCLTVMDKSRVVECKQAMMDNLRDSPNRIAMVLPGRNVSWPTLTRRTYGADVK
ncbi:hypothetical protein IFM89_026963 [Coptis chinensis]|uniref:Uncharacterized protein n=1 Tax=Coptis chinensis TaxID=261450 RepID=A0A835M1V3_9MAGN|nr:hypothetical protein IFM89_026963 [Coptis chinensis]